MELSDPVFAGSSTYGLVDNCDHLPVILHSCSVRRWVCGLQTTKWFVQNLPKFASQVSPDCIQFSSRENFRHQMSSASYRWNHGDKVASQAIALACVKNNPLFQFVGSVVSLGNSSSELTAFASPCWCSTCSLALLININLHRSSSSGCPTSGAVALRPMVIANFASW